MEKEGKEKVLNYKYKGELTKWTEEKRVKKPKFYLFYSLLILCLAYIIDEIATNINGIVKTDVLTNFFNSNSNLSLIVFTICSGISIFTFFFRALADRYGRKPLLIANLFGMSIGMFICFIAPNVYLYMIGITISFFFTPCDIQVLYIVETSPDRWRAINLALSKAIGIIGVSLISIMRRHISIRGWQGPFLIPAIVGLLVGIIAIFAMKETDVFIENRIHILKEKLKANKNKKQPTKMSKTDDEKTGIIQALKYMFNKKVLLWLFLVLFVFSITSLGQSEYASVLNSASGTYEALSEEQFNIVTLMWPYSCALIIILNGLFSDLFGRRKAAIFDTIIALIGIIYFIFGFRINWNSYLVGIFLGLFIGGYLGGIDTINVICTETSPTGLRSSIMSVISVAQSGGTLVATLLLFLFRELIPTLDLSVFIMVLVPPMLGISLFVLLKRIPETKGTDFSKIDLNKKRKDESFN